ncbi:transketolase [Thermovibrio ammonificans]|uniref:Transketolase domain-containing protein n=1 Tax=Thermovibrio ammonificans (strain DSM 15698 / JCM 12110 / HB-1) TaxID=648996 RepID=E8T3I9_THEA1|nr:transketolase [Thermovibrio ammonificans]ADU96120.1 Transketolase domain-containing protein [Thermovibrio ammonificans HB-1]
MVRFEPSFFTRRNRDIDEVTLRALAREVRKDILKMTSEAQSGHPGGAMSAADIIVTLYYYKMRHNPENPKWEERDRFVLSKGHVCPALYSVLARTGYFPLEKLHEFRRLDGDLQGHPDMHKTPGIEISTGSLGHGIGAAVGMAMGLKLSGSDSKVYCMIGDGEAQEGSVWEASMAASHYNLDNLVVILDNNNLQIDGPVDEVMSIYPAVEKWKAFGWHVVEINGHDFKEIKAALDEADTVKYKPTMIIAKTVKGKGVSFMENRAEWHGKALPPELLKEALKELGEIV